MPTKAETVLPPTTAQGCAKGLAGTPNTNTALAPTGATSQGTTDAIPASQWLTKAANNTPNTAPITARNRSWALTVTGAGLKAASQLASRMAGVGRTGLVSVGEDIVELLPD
jgi:hypothetical protein